MSNPQALSNHRTTRSMSSQETHDQPISNDKLNQLLVKMDLMSTSMAKSEDVQKLREDFDKFQKSNTVSLKTVVNEVTRVNDDLLVVKEENYKLIKENCRLHDRMGVRLIVRSPVSPKAH